ncbi:MAG: hypothetical protein H6742_17130 [Alphaproteobacteria bacterium]|nr:hypothetical protein [Alphaproteobacteria bacterium]
MTTPTPLPTTWLPPDLALALPTEPASLAGLSLTRTVLSPDALRALARELRQRAANTLADRPIADIIDVLDRAAARWLDPADPARALALDVLPALTGFSREMVAESIDLEMRSSRAADLWRVLRSELGQPDALDGFVDSPNHPGGRVRALGPGLVGAVFSSNIPALPHLTVMRALLVKAGFLGRSASAEPVFLPLYLQTLWELDPGLARCCAALSWPREEETLEATFLSELDAFVGWGGLDAERHFREAVPAGTPIVFHGHRLGFAFVSREGAAGPLETLGAGLARDVSTFDQHACLAPHVVFVEGDLQAAAAVGRAVAAGLAAEALRLPPRTADEGRLADLGQRRAVAEMDAAMGGGLLLVPEDGGPAWTVVVAAEPGFPVSPLDRFLTVVPVAGAWELPDRLRPLRGRLQNAAVSAPGPRGERVREMLARLGVARLCPPGAMATPSMMWHHDGQACVGGLVRWCDEEAVAPGEPAP